MVRKIRRFLVHYWQLSLAIVVGLVALGLQLFGAKLISHWVLAVAIIGLTIPVLVGMYQDLRTGHRYVNLLAITTIVTALILRQYWVGLAMVVMLELIKIAEDYATWRAQAELTTLLQRTPSIAHVMRGRKTVDTEVESLQPGDKIIVEAGEIVPADAVILEGEADIDETVLTGDTSPRHYRLGDLLLSGSINLKGQLTAKVLHTARNSQYEQVVRLARGAQGSQSPFGRLADRYSIPFTVLAIIIAGAAWALSHHSSRFLDVLVVATPVPLLLATPVALMAGIGRASKYGIVTRSGTAFEQLADAETFAFDKTGTLTLGRPQVSQVLAVKPFTEAEVLQLAAGVEQSSTHAIAQAIIDEAAAKGIRISPARHVNVIADQGLTATIRGQQVVIGRRSLLEERGVQLPSGKLNTAGLTSVYIASDGELAGVILLSDELRDDAQTTLKQLKQAGAHNLLLVTGDNQAAAQKVASKFDITDVHADALPAEKLHIIEKVKQRPVAFVGNGVTDAPALTVADIGIALGARGATAGSEAASILIMADNFSLVSQAVAIARRTFAIARQTIVIGITLSVLLMAAFATGRVPALIGVGIQAALNILVIFYALRAHSGKEKKQAS